MRQALRALLVVFVLTWVGSIAAIAQESDRIKLYKPFGLDWNGGPFGRIAVQATYWYLQTMDAWRERGAHKTHARP